MLHMIEDRNNVWKSAEFSVTFNGMNNTMDIFAHRIHSQLHTHVLFLIAPYFFISVLHYHVYRETQASFNSNKQSNISRNINF